MVNIYIVWVSLVDTIRHNLYYFFRELKKKNMKKKTLTEKQSQLNSDLNYGEGRALPTSQDKIQSTTIK